MQEDNMKSRGNGRNELISKKKLIGFVVLGFISLYLFYCYVSSKSPSKRSRVLMLNGWKHFDFVDIPHEVQERAKGIKIEERHLEFEFHGKKFETFFLEVGPTSSKLPPVLLLHGAGSSSDVFKKIGTISLLAALGNRVVAMDLPGHGGSNYHTISDAEEAGKFLDDFIQRERLDRPVIISASMSGHYTIPYIMNPRPSTCLERSRAFIPLAPVQTSQFTHAQYHQCEMPVLITYGVKDKQLGLESTGNLRNMPNSEVFPISGAGHAHYEDKPKEWHHLLYNFMVAVNKDRI